MEIIRLDSSNETLLTESWLRKIINITKPVEIQIRYDCILFARNPEDIVFEYLEMSFCAENIARFSKLLESETIYISRYNQYFKLIILPIRIEELVNFLYYASTSLTGQSEEGEVDGLNWLETIQEYEESIHNSVLVFPEFIDSYYANLIHGVYSNGNYKKEIYKKNPERRFGFWKSAASKKIGHTFYVSPECWLVPKRADLEIILNSYSGVGEKILLEQADEYIHKEVKLYITHSQAVKLIKPRQLLNAQNCAARLAKYIEYQPLTRHNLSDFGDVLVLEDAEFHYIFFADELYKYNFEELKDLYAVVNPIYNKIQSLVGLLDNVHCDWAQLNDDTFEELCYDLIYYNPRFDSSTIQRMGKSRSRDGGRDITVWSNIRPGNERKFFIFQCKFLKPGSSLTASKLPNAANTILQYNADGYGIFTTGIVDATLYDMLRGFSETLMLDISEMWSVYEIERFLARHQSLINRYFLK